MPSNKNAQLRYQVIDRCLSNRGRQYTWKDILDEVNIALAENDPNCRGINKTTLYEDLKDIEYRVFKGEIQRDKQGNKEKTVYLKYADPDFSINNQPLNETEINQLKSAIQVLSRIKGTPQGEWVNEMIPSLEKKLKIIPEEQQQAISFDENRHYEGLRHIGPFFNAIINKRVLTVKYQDFKANCAYEFEFHPYYLKQYNSRWFVFGHDPKRPSNIQNLALDRVKEYKEIQEEYQNSDIDWEDYFSDIIGVSRSASAKPVKVKLLIKDEEQAAYIRTKPLHESQTPLRKTDKGFETSIKVIPNYELEKNILSFGNRIIVLEPAELRKHLAEIIKAPEYNNF